VAFEPDARNHARMNARLAAWPETRRSRIETRQAALWSRKGRMSFRADGTVGSSIGEGGDEVETDTLASVAQLPGRLFIKLDVEGAEREALEAGLGLIRDRKPVLAISAYHRPDDLLDLFELVDAQDLGYRFFLRCHGGDGTDLTLYAAASGG
jgi:FkbM family methyltransferase